MELANGPKARDKERLGYDLERYFIGCLQELGRRRSSGVGLSEGAGVSLVAIRGGRAVKPQAILCPFPTPSFASSVSKDVSQPEIENQCAGPWISATLCRLRKVSDNAVLNLRDPVVLPNSHGAD